MKPINYRNATFETIQAHITGQRMRVYDGYRIHGPCTTRELSNFLQMSILSVRPRTTELVELDLVICIAGKDPREGFYMVRTEAEARDIFENKKREAIHYEQGQLNLR
jgi:hypothetical protein